MSKEKTKVCKYCKEEIDAKAKVCPHCQKKQGGKNTEAYAYISKVVFAECNRDLQDRFKVNSRNNIPRKRYEEAIDYVDNWEPKTNTKLKIDEYNRQQRFEV